MSDGENAGFCPIFLHNLSYNNKKVLHFCKTYGADTRIRTGDLILTKDALYLLSYISTLLHRATDIYYHIFGEKARGIFKKIKNILQNRCGGRNGASENMRERRGNRAGTAFSPCFA